MSSFKSENICSNEVIGYQGLFRHDRGSEQIIIKDPLINSEAVATARAKAELLEGGYVEKVISFRSVYIPSLKQNDIVSVKGKSWIIKEISLEFNPPTLIQTIKGVRYE